MSDESNAPTPNVSASSDAKPKRKVRESYDVTGLARARLRARGIRSDERLTAECKVVRGQLRSTYWSALVKAAPKSYGPRGKVKTVPNDRRPWGPIPKSVADVLIKNARR
jgi:hypothetical protein